MASPDDPWREYALNTTSSRRAWIRARIIEGLGVIGACLGIESFFERKARDLLDEENNMVSSLFGPAPEHWVSIVPAAHHPFQPLEKGQSWYPIENELAQTYSQRFFSPQVKFRITPDFPEVQDDDGIVLLGSQVSNVNTRQILGSPWEEEPIFDVPVCPGMQWKTRLRWNLRTPLLDVPTVRRVQYGKGWKTEDHRICDRKSDKVEFKSYYPSPSIQKDDYLLVTALPRYKAGKQMILILAGLHGPGTRTAGHILTYPPMGELQKVRERTHDAPYYQALFHVSLTPDITGELRPREVSPADPCPVSLVDACPLEVTFR